MKITLILDGGPPSGGDYYRNLSVSNQQGDWAYADFGPLGTVGIQVYSRTDYNDPSQKTGYETSYHFDATLPGFRVTRATALQKYTVKYYDCYDDLVSTVVKSEDSYLDIDSRWNNFHGEFDYTLFEVYHGNDGIYGNGYYDERYIRTQSDIELVIYAETIYYTLKYDANGGAGAPASQSFHHKQTVTISALKPTRNGYSFLGWDENRDAVTPKYYHPDNKWIVSAPARNVTLYAIWQAVVTNLILRSGQSGIILRSSSSGTILRDS